MKSKYIKNNNICIHLDQFAVSDIVQKSSNRWVDIGNLLIEGNLKKKIFCPYSSAHLIENHRGNIELGILQDDFLSRLSNGWSFQNEDEIMANQLIGLSRKFPKSSKLFLRKTPNRVFIDSKKRTQLYELRNSLVDLLSDDKLVFINEQREKLKGSTGNSLFKSKIISATLKEYIDFTINRLKYLSTGKRYEPLVIDMSGKRVPYFLDKVMSILTSKHLVSPHECIYIAKRLETGSVNGVWALEMRAGLEGLSAYRHTPISISDTIDLQRICSVFPYVDIFIADKAKVNDIKDLDYHKKFSTRVFSGKKEDLDSFIELLKKIVVE